MSIWDNQDGVTRRQMVGGAIAALTLPGAARAGEGGRDPKKKTSNGATSGTTSFSSPDVTYPQQSLRKLKRTDLQAALDANNRGKKIVIEGFDKKTSSLVFELLLSHRLLTIDLLKDLRRAKKPEDRRGIIQSEILRADDDLEMIEENRASYQSTKSFRAERKKQNRYLRLLRKWAQDPMQGSL